MMFQLESIECEEMTLIAWNGTKIQCEKIN